MNYKRPQYKELYKRLKEKRRFIQVIMGPRQVGKTTLVNQLLGESKIPYHFVSADDIGSNNSTWISQQWETARVKLGTLKFRTMILAIDEVQKIDNWSEVIKSEWDRDSKNKVNIKVILLGSSRLLLQQGLTESLAGRFETIFLGHWSYQEMRDGFGWNTNQFAWFGGYPGSAELIKDEQRWKDYIRDSLIETTISKDILMLTRIDKPALLKNLFNLGCLYSGQILSFNKILGQLQDAGNTTTLSHYLKLMDTAGLIGGIEKYYVESVRKRASSPKFQVYNTALLSSQMHESFKQILLEPEKWGRIVESAIGAHLFNYARTEGYDLYYWRHQNDEIDFVLKYGGKVIGLEIKSGSSKNISGMNAFQKQHKPNKVLLISNTGLPWEEFITINPIELF